MRDDIKSARWIIYNGQPTYMVRFIDGGWLEFNRSWIDDWKRYNVPSAMKNVRESTLETELKIDCKL